MAKLYGTPGDRILSPDAARSRKLASCDDEGAQLLFDRLITTSCDQGRQQGDAGSVKAACFPIYAKATARRIEGWLRQLHDRGLIIRYDAEGVQVVQITEWWRYQGTQRRAYRSRWPGPEGWADRIYSKLRKVDPEDNDSSEDAPSTGRQSAVHVPSSGRREDGSSPDSCRKKTALAFASAFASAFAGAGAGANGASRAQAPAPPRATEDATGDDIPDPQAGPRPRRPRPARAPRTNAPAWPPGNVHRSPHAAVLAGFVALFAELRAGASYAVQGAKDGTAARDLLVAAGARPDSAPEAVDLAVDAILARARTMLTHRDEYFRAGDLGTLRSGWNRLAPVAAGGAGGKRSNFDQTVENVRRVAARLDAEEGASRA